MISFSEFIKTPLLENVEVTKFFNILHKINNYKDLKKYCSTNLVQLGLGSSRAAYDLSNIDPLSNNVLKVSINTKGIQQTKEEIALSKNGYEYFIHVSDYDPNGLWIEVEKAKKFNGKTFKSFFGHEFKNDAQFMRVTDIIYDCKENHMSVDDVKKEIEEKTNIIISKNNHFGKLILEIADYCLNHNGLLGDLLRIPNWGIVNRNGKEIPVIIDFGFSEDVCTKYYDGSRKKSPLKDIPSQNRQAEFNFGSNIGKDVPMKFNDENHKKYMQKVFVDIFTKLETIIKFETKETEFKRQISPTVRILFDKDHNSICDGMISDKDICFQWYSNRYNTGKILEKIIAQMDLEERFIIKRENARSGSRKFITLTLKY